MQKQRQIRRSRPRQKPRQKVQPRLRRLKQRLPRQLQLLLVRPWLLCLGTPQQMSVLMRLMNVQNLPPSAANVEKLATVGCASCATALQRSQQPAISRVKGVYTTLHYTLLLLLIINLDSCLLVVTVTVCQMSSFSLSLISEVQSQYLFIFNIHDILTTVTN